MIQDAEPHHSGKIERVQFCRHFPAQRRSSEYRDLVACFWKSSFLARYGAYFFIGLPVVFFAWKLENRLGFSITWPVMALLAMAAAYLEIAHFAKSIKGKKEAVADADVPKGRLCCVGDAADLSQYGEFADVPFEPRVFRASLALGLGSDLGLALLLINGMLLASYYFQDNAVGFISVVAIVVLFPGLLLFRPKYFRLVPGKLEVLTFSFLRWSPRKHQQFDLRNARIIADLRSHIVVIDLGKCVVEYTIRFLPERKRFVHSLFLAAMSTHEPAPLPADALSG